MVDNQIEMQKMQQEIFDNCAWRFGEHPEDYREVTNNVGEDLYNLGYRNYKDKVVMSKQEYKNLKEIFADLKSDKLDLKNEIREKDNKISLLEESINCIKFNIDLTRKETVREVITEIQAEIFKYLGVQSIEEADKLSLLGSLLTYDLITDKLHELAHRNGVEIGE